MKSWVKTALHSCTVLSVTLVCTVCFAQSPSSQNWANSSQNWRNNPNNWKNNPDNWQNSSQNWNNSPDNWKNSGNNFNSANGIYDGNGNRIGYSVPSGSGGLNFFNNDGSRRAYAPPP